MNKIGSEDIGSKRELCRFMNVELRTNGHRPKGDNVEF